MKIVYLNVDHGILEKKLLDFVYSQSKTVDVFCFQETDKKIYKKLTYTLLDYRSFVMEKCVDESKQIYSVSTFVKKKHKTRGKKKLLDGQTDVGMATFIKLFYGNQVFSISNVHGKSQPADKLDNIGRINQSEIIINTLAELKYPKIIGGDFNLMPETKSITMFEKMGYGNLIKDYRIPTTRNEFAWRNALQNKAEGRPYVGKQLFADYIFVSPEIKVKNFSVPDMEISDHLPLILEIDSGEQ